MNRQENIEQTNKLMSERLRALRIQAGKTQKEIAEMLGINRATYSYYESGKTSLPVDSLIFLCHFYGVSADTILGRSPE